MHIAFLNYDDFQGPSGIHIFHLANFLSEKNVETTVLVPKKKECVNIFGDPRFKVFTFAEAKKKFKDSAKPELIHAWTPRETTRRFTEYLSRRFHIPYIVHLEDNEEAVISAIFDLPIEKIGFWRKLKFFYPPKPKPLSHPKRYKEFISNSAGATLIIENLKAFVPPHIPSIVIWPACEESIFSMPLDSNRELRKRLGIPHQNITLTYPGNAHKANVQDIINLYEAVRLVRNKGLKVTLIRIGKDYVKFKKVFSSGSDKCLIELGDLPPKEIPTYLSAADILVQTGSFNPFNEFRFPSKLPMFLASGRPVILPRVNIAKYLTDRKNAFFLEKGTPQEIADSIQILAQSPNMRKMMGEGGRKFAMQNFSWSKTAQKLLLFYNKIIGYSST